MKYAIDLNSRQAGRAFEQAIRSNASVTLDVTVCDDHQTLKGFVASGDGQTLMVELVEPPERSLEGLQGSYCDVGMTLGGHQYMFCADVVDMVKLGGTQTLVLCRPESLQVAQRRRFRRAFVADSSIVQIATAGAQGHQYKAYLFNISQDGLACRAGREVGDVLLIGDVVHSQFELPHCETEFELDAVVCNKTAAADPDWVILGLQFVRNPEDSPCRETLRKLAEFLTRHHQASL